VAQDLNKAIELYQEAAEYENQDAVDALARLSK
jgi:TPR repeat protein